MAQMVFHQGAAHGAQRLLYGRNLHQDIGAVAFFLHQALQTAHLPFDPAQAFQIRRFNFWIDGQRLPAFSLRAATAGGRAWNDFGFSRRHECTTRLPPAIFQTALLYYTPSPYVKNATDADHATSQ
jgi:hypothetical protein